jgi:hypothetical protein
MPAAHATTLADVALIVKSANAGASWLTFDIEFPDAEVLRWVMRSGALAPAAVARVLHVAPGDVRVFNIETLNSVKVTVPRRDPRCGQAERDFDGVQQFIPLLALPVPAEVETPTATVNPSEAAE